MFKPGDRLKLKPEYNQFSYVKQKEIYEVYKIEKGFLILKGIEHIWWCYKDFHFDKVILGRKETITGRLP
jgi:hypothetical protein